MDFKIEVVGREQVPANDRQSVTIETHTKRGDTYNVQKVDTVMENDSVVFRVPGGGRLVITTPDAENEIVYDAAQGAAVRRSSQQNDEGRADDPRTGAQREPADVMGRRHPSADVVAAEQNRVNQQGVPNSEGSIKANLGPGGARPIGQPQTDSNRPQMNAPRTTPPAQTSGQKFGNTPTPEEAKRKAEAEAEARKQQQSGSGRPAGEKPPAAGSTVGSPPSGNEGGDK